MKSITHSQLVELLRASKGALPVGIRAVTDAKLLKTGNPYVNVTKEIRAVAFVGADYGDAVRREGVGRQGAFEADAFVSAPLPAWKGVVIPNKVYCHKGNGRLYLRTQSTPGMRKRQPAKVISYNDASGKVLSHEQVRPYLPAKSVSAKQSAVGMDAPLQVDVREYAFDSIRVLRIGGRAYRLLPDA
jgi:hypothetical protein